MEGAEDEEEEEETEVVVVVVLVAGAGSEVALVGCAVAEFKKEVLVDKTDNNLTHG